MDYSEWTPTWNGCDTQGSVFLWNLLLLFFHFPSVSFIGHNWQINLKDISRVQHDDLTCIRIVSRISCYFVFMPPSKTDCLKSGEKTSVFFFPSHAFFFSWKLRFQTQPITTYLGAHQWPSQGSIAILAQIKLRVLSLSNSNGWETPLAQNRKKKQKEMNWLE